MFLNKDIKETILPISNILSNQKSFAFKLVASALMALIAAILQAAGGVIPGIGMLISPFSTAPIIISVLILPSYGILSYLLTIFLLLLIQPSELFVFPFTTGAMAIGIGLGFVLFSKLWKVITFSSLFLCIGICLLLYVFQFPVLGPFLIEFRVLNIFIIYSFSLVYCWLWIELVLRLLPKITNSLRPR
ncbi:dolichyl-phosphate-mannose--protein O-mannosyl transferase [Neobacillus niacini]|jgi:hypothetical protein|uniref:hypothetical protein n=1 Tax=Neobacillus niacini TaxID=86668 RepID=UPI0027863C1F|nr:hypothetical protein [Neobacillus niacini]MDQ1004598.1 dolichyl-phosphate-mannose--protein O-mannosyl transferase [Neobacillus niacini]